MILIFGDGLLGTHLYARYEKECILIPHAVCGIQDGHLVARLIDTYRPEAVINCAGITRRRQEPPSVFYEINGEAPWQLARLCADREIKLVHISTSSVFSGTRGHYRESDPVEGTDVYSRSKIQGEVTYKPHITVRCSFVGLPDPKGRGLLAWLTSHAEGARVPGFVNVFWNGLTTLALADLLMDLAKSKLYGLIHLFGETVTKYDILRIVTDVFRLPYTIEPVEEPKADFTLATNVIHNPCLQVRVPFRVQVEEMKEWQPRLLRCLQSL